jgi:hypothetical protein
MSGLSRFLALALFDASLNPVRATFTPPSGLWLGLHTGAPNDATYGLEATFGDYARQPLNSLTAQTVTGTGAGDLDVVITNGSALIFPASTGPSPQSITHWAIWDLEAPGDGNILYSGHLGSARLVTVGDSVVVPEGNLIITLK